MAVCPPRTFATFWASDPGPGSRPGLSRSSRAAAAGGGDASGGGPIPAPLKAADVVPRGGVCGRACVFTQLDALYEPTCGAQQG
jgi:hypothetical protein